MPEEAPLSDVPRLLEALLFASRKHRDQRRKNPEASPYINHPIEVAEVLARVGGINELLTLQAAILHDTIEDTDTTPEEIESTFGAAVRSLVEEMTDDKTLSKQRRKDLQIEHAPHLSERAKNIKLSDKICNVRDMAQGPPPDWPPERRMEYFSWCRRVVEGCRGVNEQLAREFDSTVSEGEERLVVEHPSMELYRGRLASS
jgi:(p)ppGpp synthase/HD superfamily hydrolase